MFFCGSVPSSGIFLKSEDFDHLLSKYLNFHCLTFPKSFQIYHIVLMRDLLHINAVVLLFINVSLEQIEGETSVK